MTATFHPKVSIITVSLYSEEYLEQTYKNIEYIIIDGGSSDNTKEIIKKYENDQQYFSLNLIYRFSFIKFEIQDMVI